MRTALVILVLIGAASGGVVYYAKHATTDTRPPFRAVAVTRGDLLSSISATGTQFVNRTWSACSGCGRSRSSSTYIDR